MAPLRVSITKSEWLPDDLTAFVPLRLWKSPFITTWDGSQNQNHPTDSADQGLYQRADQGGFHSAYPSPLFLFLLPVLPHLLSQSRTRLHAEHRGDPAQPALQIPVSLFERHSRRRRSRQATRKQGPLRRRTGKFVIWPRCSRSLGKSILFAPEKRVVGAGPKLGIALQTLPISCLFWAPKASIARHVRATPGGLYVIGRKEVKLKSARGVKRGKARQKG